MDGADNLYVVDADTNGQRRIQKREIQGHWSVIATQGAAVGQVDTPSGLAVDGAGNLYVADTGNHRVLKYAPGP